ncbi:MAG: ADP-ribosylation factor-like protein [Promethearchaeota archaeon]
MYQFVNNELQRLIDHEIESMEKVAIFGLENAGKTSIVKKILYKFESLMSLAPTRDYNGENLEFLGRELIIRDFGGKARFRTNYFKHPEINFRNIKYLYYIIDCQALHDLRQNIVYFLKIIEYCAQINPDLEIYIFFHKLDPNIPTTKLLNTWEKDFLNDVLPVLQEQELHATLFYTSIKDIQGIIYAFIEPLLGNRNIYSTVCLTTKQFCIENQFEFGGLFIENFELGHYYANQQLLQEINQKLVSMFQNIAEKRKPNYAKNEKSHYNEDKLHKILFKSVKFEIEIRDRIFPFFFIIGVKKSKAEDKNLDQITTKIETFVGHLKLVLKHSELIRLGELHTERIIKISF